MKISVQGGIDFAAEQVKYDFLMSLAKINRYATLASNIRPVTVGRESFHCALYWDLSRANPCCERGLWYEGLREETD